MENNLLQATINTITGHEFRTPMNAIFGFANLIHDSAGSISETEQKELSSYILNSAKKLMDNSERLNKWYHYSADVKTPRVHEKIPVEAVTNLIEETAKKYTVSGDLFVFTSNASEIYIQGEKDFFFSAMVELFDNAFKFSSKNTTVLFSVVVGEHQQLLVVQNYSEETSSYDLSNYTVFRQFNRHKYEQQGLGLGLEIAKLGIKHCGGKLNIPLMVDENGFKKIRIEVLIPKDDNVC